MSEDKNKNVEVVVLREFVTEKGSYKPGESATVNAADAATYIRRKFLAHKGSDEALAMQASAKSSKTASKK